MDYVRAFFKKGVKGAPWGWFVARPRYSETIISQLIFGQECVWAKRHFRCIAVIRCDDHVAIGIECEGGFADGPFVFEIKVTEINFWKGCFRPLDNIRDGT